MKEFLTAILKWQPYLDWRAKYLQSNPKLPSAWQVGAGRLYKEKCFCIDKVEAIRKCGCEYHLKMAELVAGLKKWRRGVSAKIKKSDLGHTCNVRNSTKMHVVNNVHLINVFVHLAGLQLQLL